MPDRARSYYRGLRLNITQSPGDRPCIVTLATKPLDKAWDDWSLLFPAIRVPVPEGGISGYQDILRLCVTVIEELLEVDRRYE